VLGREFEWSMLLVVSDLPQKDVFDRLDEAANARVLIKTKDGAYRFAHALVRDVIYKKLSSAERVARHNVIAEKLLAHYGSDIDSHAAELARHFGRALPASDPQRVIDLSSRAALQQTALGSHRAAAKHWQQAAAAYGHVKGGEGGRVLVLLELARSLARAGQQVEARDAFFDAATLARTFSLATPLAEAALGFAALAGDAPAQRRAVLEEALSNLTAAHDEANASLQAAVTAAIAAGPESTASISSS
jgi:predicted ATPase